MARTMTRGAGAVLAVTLATMGLAGCAAEDSNEALDAYVEQERAVAASSPDIGEIYNDITIEPVYPAGVTVTYTYADPIDAGEASAYFDQLVGSFDQECAQQVFPAMREFGVEGDLEAGFAFANPDGSMLWEYTCESA